jgi:iron(III) transport system ATP-binding protein
MQLNIKNLSVKYGDILAVNNLSVELESGKVLVLLGPSGCGKTTTLRCIAGFEKPIQGTITIGDTVIYDADKGINVNPEKRNLGMVFQSYAIWPHMTVFDNIAFGLQLKKLPKKAIKERVDEMLKLTGLEGLGSRSATMLSGGQMQRVALARSLANEPQLLLLDEPLSNLDQKLRDYLRFELREIQHKTKVTTIYVTHDQTEAVALADLIAVMKNGSIVQLGPPEDIYNNPHNVYVASFVGSSNIIPVEIIKIEDKQYRLKTEDGSEVICNKNSNDSFGVGERVFIGLRQENIFLSKEKDNKAGWKENHYKGNVIVHNFLGTHTRYIISLFNKKCYVTVPGSTREFNVGESICINTPPEKVQLLTDDI